MRSADTRVTACLGLLDCTCLGILLKCHEPQTTYVRQERASRWEAEAMGGKAKPTKHTAKELAKKVCRAASGCCWHEAYHKT